MHMNTQVGTEQTGQNDVQALQEVKSMAKDDRDILEVLRFELDFLEHGGYGRSVRTPWKETSIFQDSLRCVNYGDPARTRR